MKRDHDDEHTGDEGAAMRSDARQDDLVMEEARVILNKTIADLRALYLKLFTIQGAKYLAACVQNVEESRDGLPDEVEPDYR